MITLKTKAELELMNRANTIVLSVLAELGAMVEPGVDIADLDAYAARRTREEGGKAAFKGYQGFPATLCVSINEQVVHGIPSSRALEEGDIVGIDFGVFVEGFCGDGAQTFPVGNVEPDRLRLLEVIEQALVAGIGQMRPGNRTGDVGHAVQSAAEAHGYGIVRDFVGHGIGRKMHEKPQLPNYGEPGRGVRLEEGMVLAIEPMLNLGTAEVEIGDDRWTVSTLDRLPSAHIERSVAITAEGPWILGSGFRPGVVDTALPAIGSMAAVSRVSEAEGHR